MANSPNLPVPKETKSSGQYEIAWNAGSRTPGWGGVASGLQSWLNAGGDLLGNTYAGAARLVMGKIEAFEDLQAERKARLRVAGHRALQDQRRPRVGSTR